MKQTFIVLTSLSLLFSSVSFARRGAPARQPRTSSQYSAMTASKAVGWKKSFKKLKLTAPTQTNLQGLAQRVHTAFQVHSSWVLKHSGPSATRSTQAAELTRDFLFKLISTAGPLNSKALPVQAALRSLNKKWSIEKIRIALAKIPNLGVTVITPEAALIKTLEKAMGCK